MDQGPPRRRRARPVADAPVEALLQRSEDLTKGWLLALLEQAPLDEARGILAADLARDGPRVCDAIVRALASDDDLRRLEPGGALERLASRTGEFAGGQGVAATSRAVDTIGAVIWSALRSALADPDPEQISELAERLARVVELVRGAALRRAAGEVSDLAEVPPPGPGPDGPPHQPPSRQPLREAPGYAPPRATSPPPPPPPPPPASPPAATGDAELAPDTLWMGAVEDEIRTAERSGSPLSLLLVELEEADRLEAVGSVDEVSATFGRFAQAVRSAVRRQDILACETDTRAWIIARDTGRLGAQALGARIVGAVRASEPWRGAPMSVSVGLAVLGDDGRVHTSLIEAAEESRFAAAASGLGVQDMRADHEQPGPQPAG